MAQPEPLTRLIEHLQRLPGIGRKSAQRLAFHVLKAPRENADRLCEAIRDVKDRITYCSACSNVTDVDPCPICTDDSRNRRLICVVEEPPNVLAIERSRDYNGSRRCRASGPTNCASRACSAASTPAAPTR
jgi:recombination protein RecR